MAERGATNPIPELLMGGPAYAARQAKRAEEILDLISNELFERPQLASKSKPAMYFLARIIEAHKQT